MMRSLRSQSGFTLLEVTVTAVISTLLAGSVLSMLYLSNRQLKESAGMAKLTMMYDVASEAIQRQAREAYSAGGNGEVPPLAPLTAPFSGLGWVTFYNGSPMPAATGGFGVGGDGILKEWRNGAFQTFKIGLDSLYVSDFHFAILAQRRAVRYRMTLRHITEEGDTLLLTNPRETALCRNNLN